MRRIIKQTSLAAAVLILTCANTFASAATPSSSAKATKKNTPMVKVNLIVFTHVNDQSLMSQAWVKQLIVPYVKNAIQLIPANYDPTSMGQPSDPKQSTKSKRYKLLPTSKIGMQTIVKKLNANNDKVVLDIAWKQPASGSDQWIHFYGGQAYDETGDAIAQQTPNINSVSPVFNATFWQINGLISIQKSNFYNVTTKLYLTLPQALANNIDAQQYGLIPLMTYPSTGYRRLKAGQTAYFDHPLFGALVKITTIKKGKNNEKPSTSPAN